MRWFYTTSTEHSITSRKNEVLYNSLVLSPVKYNDVIYGTFDTPASFFKDSSSTLFHWVEMGIGSDLVIPGSSDSADDGPFFSRMSYSRVVGVIDDTAIITNSNYIETDDSVISGRYRAKSVWNSEDLLNVRSYLFPIISTVYLKDGTIKPYIVAGCAPNRKSYISFGTIDSHEDFGGYNYIYSTDNTIYEDMIIDFGEIPQHCPKLFKDKIEKFFNFIYPNTYTIQSTTGETVVQIIEQPPIKKTNLQWAGRSFQLSLTGTNDVIQTLTWEDTVPQGYTFVGLSTSRFGSVIIPLGESNTNIESSETFYPVFRPYRPFSTLFQIELYKNTAEANRVDKTDYLTYIRSVGGVMREPSSVTDLTVTLQLNEYPNFNYVKINELKRYYFVNDITLINANMYELDLSVDPLMSYKSAILGLTAFVDRNEFLSNLRIIDKKRVVEQGVDIETHEIENNIISNLSAPFLDTCFVINGYKISIDTTTPEM